MYSHPTPCTINCIYLQLIYISKKINAKKHVEAFSFPMKLPIKTDFLKYILNDTLFTSMFA